MNLEDYSIDELRQAIERKQKSTRLHFKNSNDGYFSIEQDRDGDLIITRYCDEDDWIADCGDNEMYISSADKYRFFNMIEQFRIENFNRRNNNEQ